MTQNRLNHFHSRLPRTLRSSLTALAAAFLAPALLLAATDQPKNLGGGLAGLVKRGTPAKSPNALSAPTAGANAHRGVDASDRAIYDGKGRVLVTVHLKNAAARAAVAALQGVEIKAEDMSYQGGAMDVFVPLEQAAQLAKTRGVSSVFLSLRPIADVGATTSQGVHQHRVDQITNQNAQPVTGITGKGITVGVLSDSFNTAPGRPKAGDDIRSGDLPGGRQAVRVLADDNSGNDEGRAMCQIIYDMAPDARLAFATANASEIGFANNIRRLAAPHSDGGAGAQVIVDDIIYLDEGMFQDTIVARAVDEVVAQGVSYFSSAGNRPATQGYYSDFHPVLDLQHATDGTNINLANVPPELYAGGFHNFNPDGRQDIAQTVLIGYSVGDPTPALFDFQWDDAYDVNPVAIGPNIVNGTGTVPPGGFYDFSFPGTANERVQIQVTANPATPDFDSIIQLIAPDGSTVTTQDTGTDETLLVVLQQTGTYTVRVTQFGPQTGGTIDYSVDQASGSPLVTTDFNILFFDAAGNFIGATGEDNTQTNRPIEIAQIFPSQTQGNLIQVVIARSNIPPAHPTPASRIRYVTFTTGEPQEYFSFETPITFGHNSAAGGNGVAAYAFYPPFVPEGFTSPGPALIAFDQENNRLPRLEIRQKPDLAAMDGANTTFFVSDASQDTDSFPNFFGTSAAAPHAAAIAALVLEANGGPGSVSPAQMKDLLHRSTFPHDLDPYMVTGRARSPHGQVALRMHSDGSSLISTMNPNAFELGYRGRGSLTSFVFNPDASSEHSGDTTEPLSTTPGFTSRPGLVFDNRSPTVGYPFTTGFLKGVPRGAIHASLSNQVPPPALSGTHFYTLTLNFEPGSFARNDFINFGIDRDESDAFGPSGTVGGNSADLLGANVLIPEGTLAPGGMQFSGTTTNGSFSGVLQNKIGSGYSSLDGYGFINAEAAVHATITPQQ